jgi:hypothetical protein
MNQETAGKTKAPKDDAAIKLNPAVDHKDAPASVPPSEDGEPLEPAIVP